MNRKIKTNGKTLLIALLTLGMLAGGAGSAYAVTALDATAQFTAGVAGASELLDFNSGGSQIYDDWHLHIKTDDNLYLDAPGTTYVSGAMDLTGNLIVGNGNAAGVAETITLGSTGGSSIYDDWHLHIKTDDDLFIDAPGTTTISGALAVTGAGIFTGGVLGYTAATAPTTALGEGEMYYDTAADLVYVNTGTAAAPSWTALGTATGLTLDASYNQSGGAATVAVDAGAMTWNLTNDHDFVLNANAAGSNVVLQASGTEAWSWDLQGTLDVTGGVIGSDLIDITRNNSATDGDILDIDMGTAAIAGDAIDISWGGAGTGDAIAINMDNNLAGAALAVTDGSGVRTDALIDIVSDSTTGDYIFLDVDGATAGHGVNFDVDGAMTGNLMNVNYGVGAATGDVLNVTMGTNVSGGVLAVTSVNTSGTLIDLNVDPAGASTVIGMNIDYDTTAVSGNMLDLNFSNLAHTGDAINIDMGDAAVGAQAFVLNTADGVGTVNPIVLTYNNTSGQRALMDINYDGTRGGIMDIDLTGIFTNEAVIAIDTNKAFTANIIDITTSAVASAGNLIDLNFGNIADTGDALNIAMGAAAVDAQGLVVTTSAGVRTSSVIQITENNTTGTVATIDWDSAETRGGFMDIDFSGALATENLIDIDATGAWTSNLIDITTGGGSATGNVMNITLSGSDTASQAFVVANGSITSVDGWLMDVDATAAFTGNAYSFNTTGAFDAAANVWAFDSSNNSTWAGDIFNIDTGDGAATGDVFDVNIEASAVNVKTLVVDSASISDAGNDGWLIDVDTTAAFAGDMISLTQSGNDDWQGDYLALDGGDSTWDGHFFEILTGSGVNTGDVMNIAIEDGSTAAQAFIINNAAATATAGWLMDVDTDEAWTAIAMDIDIGAAAAEVSTANFLDITYATTAHTGNAIDLNMGTNLAGNAFDIQAEGARSAPLVFINGDNTDAGTDDHMFDIDQTGVLNSNVLDITYDTNASDGNAVDLNMATNVAGDAIHIASAATTGNGLVITNTNARAGGSAISVVDSGTVTASAATVEITAATLTDVNLMTLTAGAQTSGNTLAIVAGASPFAGGTALDITGSANYATDKDPALLNVTASGTVTDGYIAQVVADSATTLDAVAYFSGNALTSGDLVRLENTGTSRTTGHMLAITDAADGTLGTGATVHIAQSAAADYSAVDIDTAGVGLAAGNVAAGLDIVGSGAIVSGSSLVHINAGGFNVSGSYALHIEAADDAEGLHVASGTVLIVESMTITGTDGAAALTLTNGDFVVSDGAMGTVTEEVASAAGATAIDSNVIHLTGTNTVTTITGGIDGQLLTIIFDSTAKLTDAETNNADTTALVGTATDITGADDKVIQLVYDGTSWYQVSPVSAND